MEKMFFMIFGLDVSAKFWRVLVQKILAETFTLINNRTFVFIDKMNRAIDLEFGLVRARLASYWTRRIIHAFLSHEMISLVSNKIARMTDKMESLHIRSAKSVTLAA